MGSRSSSVNSLELIEPVTSNYDSSQNQSSTLEFVTSLTFINSYSKKGSK